jgi:iron-sulfur cluster assembly protein
MVTLTENAANQIKRQLAEAEGAVASVRISVEAGGCSGTKYVVTPGAPKQANDVETIQFGLAVLCDPISLTAIEGLQIDFVDALVGGGFLYENPQATRSCGCGASFKAAAPEAGINA